MLLLVATRRSLAQAFVILPAPQQMTIPATIMNAHQPTMTNATESAKDSAIVHNKKKAASLRIGRTKLTSKIHASAGVIHLLCETILQLEFAARPTRKITALPNVVAGRMILGTFVAVLGKARQSKHESLLEKIVVFQVTMMNVWMTFLCFTEFTFPLSCGLPFFVSLERPWLLPVNALLCSVVTALACCSLAFIACVPNKDRRKLWGQGSGRVFAISYSFLVYFLPTVIYTVGTWNIGRQLSVDRWRARLESSPEFVNVLGNTLLNA